MIDTHTHIYMPEDFPGVEAADAVDRAVAAGVNMMILPGVDLDSIVPIRALHELRPKNTAIAVGLHPSEVNDKWQDYLEIILADIDKEGVVAVGEIGMDLHESSDTCAIQMEAFARQVDAAYAHNLPIIIHQRDALEQTLQVLEQAQEKGRLPRAMVFHCFTGTPADALRIITAFPQAYFGIGGVATFKNAKSVREALPLIGIDRIVLETDAPWLAPTPMRGRRNESSYLPNINRVVAETLGLDPQFTEQITDRNARQLFAL